MRRTSRLALIAIAVCGAAACEQTSRDTGAAPPEDPEDSQGEAETPQPQTSIIRPSVLAEVQPEAPPPPDPVEARVLFDVSSSDLSDEARAALDDLLATDSMGEGVWRISLTGRTDPSGNADMNARLARERAEAVRDYLVQEGFPAGQIEIAPAREPEKEPADEDAMAEARRVDVRAEPAIEDAASTQ